MDLKRDELKIFLDEKYNLYNRPAFIESDPIQVPHQFSKPEDIEIAAFLTASIAWGNRKMIIKNAKTIISLLDNAPLDFVTNSKETDLENLGFFVHRTFNGSDLIFFLKSLQNIYKNHGGLRNIFESNFIDVKSSLANFREIFFSIEHPLHVKKHVPDVIKKSAAKRLNMFLMWMVRNDNRGVHFGLWNKIPTHELKLPLDVHTANVGRKLGLLHRKQNDWQAVEEITDELRKFDEKDPVKYDFALFGLGVFEKF
ncbi:MAG: TIGR02757 family protein [Bacteroidales bacterium]|nr:TIGR02757 family protein [Bacteroidales bacterium]